MSTSSGVFQKIFSEGEILLMISTRQTLNNRLTVIKSASAKEKKAENRVGIQRTEPATDASDTDFEDELELIWIL